MRVPPIARSAMACLRSYLEKCQVLMQGQTQGARHRQGIGRQDVRACHPRVDCQIGREESGSDEELRYVVRIYL